MVYLLWNEVDRWYICVETRLLEKQLHWIYGSFCGYRHQKRTKGTKCYSSPWMGLYCLVVIFLLLYVICVFLEQKTHERRKKTRKDIRALITESDRKYIKNLSGLELTNDEEPTFAWLFGQWQSSPVGSPVRVGTQGFFRLCLKTFIAPFLSTRDGLKDNTQVLNTILLFWCRDDRSLPLVEKICDSMGFRAAPAFE